MTVRSRLAKPFSKLSHEVKWGEIRASHVFEGLRRTNYSKLGIGSCGCGAEEDDADGTATNHLNFAAETER
jgi:hypothetical protein